MIYHLLQEILQLKFLQMMWSCIGKVAWYKMEKPLKEGIENLSD